MATYYLAGWDTAAIGTFSVVVGGTVGSGTATVTASTYAHTDLSSVTGTGTYTAFAAAVQTALNAVVAGWTVSYSTSTYAYTISHATAFTLTWTGTGGTNLQRALGFTATVGSTTSATSTVRPYYVIVPAITARSQVSDVYEPDDIVKEAVSDGGTSFAISKDTTETFSDWEQQMESASATLARSAVAAVPWTWEAFFKHLRGAYPFRLVDGSTSTVHKLREKGAAFTGTTRRRVAVDYDDLWIIMLMTRDLGTV
jgi:hypothetical protein